MRLYSDMGIESPLRYSTDKIDIDYELDRRRSTTLQVENTTIARHNILLGLMPLCGEGLSDEKPPLSQ